MKSFSVLILTYNEQDSIGDCIESVSCSNDIVVLDSFSQDGTKELCLQKRVRFYENRFTNYSNQRNYGLHQIPFLNEYVLILDADERVSAELISEILKICNQADLLKLNVYLVRRRVVLDGKLLKWNFTSSVWIERLVKPKLVQYVGLVHEKLNYEGKSGLLRSYIIHHQFSKGIKNWLNRRKKYAILEQIPVNDTPLGRNNSEDIIVRRIRLRKYIIKYIPFYYIFYFIYNILFKLAFFDGLTGIKYVSLEAYSLFLIAKFKRNA